MPTSDTSAVSGRLWLTAMGLFLACAGLLFTGILWTAYQRAAETRAWEAVPCLIVSSKIDSKRPSPNSNIAYRPEIQYRYEFQGEKLTGHRIKRVDGATSHEERARAMVESYPVGLETTCYVNPAAPGFAILRHGSKAPLYSIWFPLLFVIGGLGMAWTAWK